MKRKVNDIQLFLEKFSLGNDRISMHWRKEEGCIQLFAFVKPNKKTLVIILSYICMVQTGRIEILNIWIFQIINHILIFSITILNFMNFKFHVLLMTEKNIKSNVLFKLHFSLGEKSKKSSHYIHFKKRKCGFEWYFKTSGMLFIAAYKNLFNTTIRAIFCVCWHVFTIKLS